MNMPGMTDDMPSMVAKNSTSLTMDSMTMHTTFTNWSTITLTLLFESWRVTKPWQFFLTWVAVFSAAAFYHVLKFLICGLDCVMLSEIDPHHRAKKNLQSQADYVVTSLQESVRADRPGGWIVMKLLHGLLTGMQYGLSLMLMLVAMTMNPSLILALCLGYVAGDILLADYNCDLQTGSNSVVQKFSSWWTKHSYPDHFALLSGMLTFPLSIFITYALIDSVCYEYSHGNITANLAPFAGSWMADWCDFELEPTQKSALQISLAVYYSWLVVVGIICLISNCNKRVFDFMHRSHTLLRVSNGEIILSFGVACLLIFNCVYWHQTFSYLLDNSPLYKNWMDKSVRRPTYFATQVTGRLLDVSLGLLMLPVAKNSVLQLLLGVSYTGALGFHKAMGWFFVIVSVVHVGVYVKSATLDNYQSVMTHMLNTYDPTYAEMMGPGSSQNDWGVGNWMTVMGTIATILMALPILFSFSFVRRRFYNLFYYSHLFLHVGIVFLWLHASSDLYYMLPAIGLYASDILLRLISRFSPHKVLKVTPTPGGLLRVDFDISTNNGAKNYAPGQFVRVCFPTINSLEWHPYTLASRPGSSMGTIYLDPKVVTLKSLPRELGWSRAVGRVLQKGFPVSVEGPFGEMGFDPRDMDVVVCLVAGSGVTVGLSVAHCIDSTPAEKGHVKTEDSEINKTQVSLMWSVRDTSSYSELASVFSELSDRASITIHRTTEDTTSPALLADDKEWDGSRRGGEDTGSASMSAVDGRVNFIRYLSDFKSKGDVGIVICGPPSFTDFARIAAHDFAAHNEGKVFISVESFSL